MSRFALLVVLGIVLLFTQSSSADKPEPSKKQPTNPFAEARQRLLRGNYDEAIAAYEAGAKKDEALRPLAAIGISQAYRATGGTDKALTILSEALKAKLGNANLHSERANLFYELGRWDEATIDIDAALAKNPDHLLARWTQARILQDRGELDAADKAIRSIVRYYTARSNGDNDITDPDELLVIAEAGAENARWHNLSKQFNFILNEVIHDALKADPDLWQAEVQAGSMLLEKYNRPDAVEAFDKALKINPKAVTALVGKGQAAMLKFDLKEVDHYADQALKINPNHAAALRLKADLDLVASDWKAAETKLDAARKTNPRDAATLGKLSGVYRLQRRTADFDKIVKEAENYDKKPGVFYYELGETLEERRRYTQADGYYRKAAELRPMLAGPRTGLGMLQLRLGNEKEGRVLLTKAFDADPFNVRVANSLKVLKHLDGYATITTPHYELRYDATKDKILAEFIAEYLEETHAELKKQFGYEPPGRVLIEVFNSHEMFSGRTVGLPDLHTIGACTGKVVVMASPKAKGVKKPFHWGRVIRHELTHIFNLAQTDFQCPHWLTEGLAVRNENLVRSPTWTVILRDHFVANTLFNLDTVMYGFVRPKTPDEWTLAYAQSQLYVEYLTKTHGEASVGKLLTAYREGMDTAEALKSACGVEKAVFEAGYRAHVEAIVKPYILKAAKRTEEKQRSFDELVKLNQDEPDNLEVAAQLAELYLRRNKAADARKLVEGVLAKEKNHPLASMVKARLLMRSGDDDAALVVLEELQAARPDDHRLLLALARIYTEAKDFVSAAKVLEHGRKVAPIDGDWSEQLVRIYKASDNTEKLIEVMTELLNTDPDELDGRVQLAKISLEAERFPDAERIAKDALQIDVTNRDARTVLMDALKAQKKDAEIEKLRKRYGRDDD